MYIDVHSHILPKVDDGTSSDTEALEILDILKSQDINAVVFSPHFYPHNESSISGFCSRIGEAFDSFKPMVKSGQKLFLGAEVHCFNGISAVENIESLCIGNTNYMLLELPYRRISTRTVNDVIELSLSRGITPIFAHIERYRKFECYDRMLNLISDKYALGQVNSYSFFERRTKRFVRKLVKEGYVHLIGSDAHRPIPPAIRINDALNLIEKKIGAEYADKIRQNSDKIYNELISAENDN